MADMPQPMTNQAMRENARSMIRRRISELRRKADGLEELLAQIPANLHPSADEALWQLAMNSR
jgi:hypothetical protein